MSFIVREYDEPDFEQVSKIRHALYTQKTGSFSIVANLKDNRMLRSYVVMEDEQVAGYGLLWEQMPLPHLILKLEILFRPGYDNPNAMDSLFSRLNHDIQAINPVAVQARTFDDQEHLLHFFEKYGFTENHRMLHVYLHVAEADLSYREELEERLGKQGITITTLAEERIGDADYFRKLQTLNSNTWADYPSEPLLPPTSPNDHMITHKDNIPEAYFIAKKGDIYISHSHLMKMESDSENLRQGLTATLKEFRGLGVATALKIKGIEFAKSHGYRGIFTSNRSTNPSMKSVNDKLGWRPDYSEIRMEKMIRKS